MREVMLEMRTTKASSAAVTKGWVRLHYWLDDPQAARVGLKATLRPRSPSDLTLCRRCCCRWSPPPDTTARLAVVDLLLVRFHQHGDALTLDRSNVRATGGVSEETDAAVRERPHRPSRRFE